MAATDDVLERIYEYRVAVRAALDHADEDPRQVCLSLLDLVDLARTEDDPVIRTWSERAIFEEAKAFLGVDDEAPALPPTSFERRVRALRAEGYTACPKCLHGLPTDDELARWSRVRTAEAERLRVRNQAVK